MHEVSLQNPYSVPSSELLDKAAPGQALSLAEALNRGYNFAIFDLLGEAWRKTKGTKGLIWGGFFAYFGVMIGAQIALYLISLILGLGAFGLASLAGGEGAIMAGAFGLILLVLFTSLVTLALTYPFIAGFNMIGIRQAAGQPLRFAEIFSHFNRTLPLLGAGILMTIVTAIGFVLFVLPGIYLSIALMLTIPLVVERKLSPWQAMMVSCKAINQHWFKVFFLFVAMNIVVWISMLPLGIGLIWTLPMFIVMIGVLYNRIFGVLPPPAN
ncbi:hypothetical protein AAFN46_03210 [Pseudomonas sp. CAU 1711]|uniref:hypothetical protein n=1 Tax=Pseudomonas sp. CAU 1711 TaxID=3140356 RepID=UPI003261AA4C